MAVHIRLSRVGAKKAPQYRVVVADHVAPAGAVSSRRLVPTTRPAIPASWWCKRERLDYWVGQGAQASHTLERLLKRKPSEAAASPPKVVPRRSPPKLWASQCSRGRVRRNLVPWMWRRSMALKELSKRSPKPWSTTRAQLKSRRSKASTTCSSSSASPKTTLARSSGVKGRTAQSMRTILTAVSTKLGRRSHLDIVD